MPNITVKMTERMYLEMKKHKEFDWNDVALEAFSKSLYKLKLIKNSSSRNNSMEQDVSPIGHKIKHEIRKRLWR
jgi:hypothetical protein